MTHRALYFPHIAMPNSAWTTQALLYWDQIASIIPHAFMQAPEPLDAFTRDLLTEGLIVPVLPRQHVSTIERFDACFIEYVEARILPRRADYQAHWKRGKTTQIHAEKLGNIPDFLVEHGLARKISWDWFELPEPLANRFMAYLATTLGAVPEVDAIPITDQTVYATMLGQPRTVRSLSRLHAQKARNVILKSLLPVPKNPIDAAALVRFKRVHGQMLPSFRRRIEAHCALIASMADAEQRQILTDAFIRESEREAEEIEAAMRPSFGQIALLSLAPLFGSGLTLSTTDAANGPAYAGAALSCAGAAYAAIASIRDARLRAHTRPLAYLAYARRTWP